MRRFKLEILRGKEYEERIFRAVQMGSIEGMAEDMMKDDRNITRIIITDLVNGATKVVY